MEAIKIVDVSSFRAATHAKAPEKKGAEARITEYVGLGVILAQVAFIALIMRTVGLDPLALRRVVYLAAVGFVVNHLLPLRYRMPFFAVFSLTGMVFILGGVIDARVPNVGLGLARTGAVAAVGVVLMAICHLRIGFWQRAGLLLAVGGVIAVFRAGIWESGVLAVVWPVVAGMFMFRVMVYLYDLATAKTRPKRGEAAAYFFLLPNACAPLFPVVDFRTFCEKHYDENALVIYQRGVKWMARGLLHLLLYRVVDRLVALDVSAVANGTDLIRFVVANVFLYLKISGGFHLMVGVLLLFGFNLPETNHRYFLASSFTDYWRRVNIYWRHFIMKVVYYPMYFRCKHLGQVKALTLATLWAFFITWAFHLYQTWWIKGAVSWSWPDGLFWGALGILVLANSIWELKRNRRRTLASGRLGAKEAFALALRTAGTFAIVALLWSLWSSPTVGAWWRIWTLADRYTLAWGAVVLGAIMLATLALEVLPGYWQRSRRETRVPRGARFGVTAGAVGCVALLGAIFAGTHPKLQARLQASPGTTLWDIGAVLKVMAEKDAEAHGQSRGYYENLTAVDQGGKQFYETMNPGRGRRYAQPTQPVPGVHFQELIPSTRFEDHDWRFDTNRWGMRDRDYELAVPAGKVRLAMLGSSHVMGFGLADKDMFEPMIEDRLNAGQTGFELLNFAIGGLSPLGQVWLLHDRVMRFRPEIVLFVAHVNDFEWTTRDVVRVIRKGAALPAEFPKEIVTRAGIHGATPEAFAVARLQPYETDILSFCYREIVRESKASGALPVYIFMPVPDDLPLNEARIAQMLQMATEAGFVAIDLSTLYDGHDPKKLIQKDEGHHMNRAGSTVVADALYAALTSDPRINLSDRARRRTADSPLSPSSPP